MLTDREQAFLLAGMFLGVEVGSRLGSAGADIPRRLCRKLRIDPNRELPGLLTEAEEIFDLGRKRANGSNHGQSST